MALTELKVRNTKPAEKPAKMTDGNGMHLLITASGSKYWRVQYRFGGKQKTLSLSVYPEVSLSEARQQIANNIDPCEKRKAEEKSLPGCLQKNE